MCVAVCVCGKAGGGGRQKGREAFAHSLALFFRSHRDHVHFQIRFAGFDFTGQLISMARERSLAWGISGDFTFLGLMVYNVLHKASNMFALPRSTIK